MPEHYFPLHPAQQDVYMDQLLNTNSPQYNIGGYIVLKGALNSAKFHEAVGSAPQVFDTFKMRFDTGSQELLCRYENDTEAALIELDFSRQKDSMQAAKTWMQKEFNTPFQLTYDTLPFAQYLIKISEQEHLFFGKYHHLITDGYGFIVYVQYVASKYAALVSGEELLAVHPSYKEQTANADSYYHSADYQQDGDYWKDKIPAKPEKLLPVKYSAINETGKSGATYNLDINDEQRDLLNEIQLTTKTGLQQLTMAALLIYFGKITSSNEFVFGTPIHKRGSRQLRNTIGMFSGILPFKGSYNKEQTVAELIKDISSTQRSDYRHQNYLIGDLSRELKINPADETLCEVLVNYEPLDFELNFGDTITANIVRLANEDERNPLQLCWRDYNRKQSLQLQVQFGYAYFTQQEIELLAQRVLFIIGQFTVNVDQPIGEIVILPPAEVSILQQFNETITAYPPDSSIAMLFEEQAEKTPEKTALIFGKEALTYKELNRRSNQLAHYLIKKGLKAETLVPICVERSTEMIVGILGILKAGGAYVPVDLDYPQDRISYMLDDTNATIILSNAKGKEQLQQNNKTVIALDADRELIAKESTTNINIKSSPDQLAYVMYTSGSTGKPKGVMVTQKGVVSLVKNAGYVSTTAADTLLVTGSPSFDATTFEYWSMLLNGGKLILCGLEELLNSESLKTNIASNEVSIMWFTSSWFNQLADSNPEVFAGLKTILVGGEKLSEYHIGKIRKLYPELKLINGYGPTENTTFSLTYQINEVSNPIPIGRPLNNRQAYILTPSNKLSPIGVTGEIFLGGAGLSKGYLNQSELTAEKFINDPNTGSRLYRTGDLGRWQVNGNIEYLGRIDDQVKIRGYRIELGEIESVLNQSELVSQGVIVVKDDANGNKRLVGYVVAKEFDKQAIQTYLSARLPDYMVPSIWLELDSIPLTSNGKADKKALPDPELTDISALYVAPETETEIKLSEIWQELLGVDKVGVHDNFFELGGHSLLAMRVIAAIRKQLKTEVLIKDVFNHPTIALLSAHITDQQNTLVPAIEVADPRPEHIPLSFSQERLWFIDRLEGSIQYHVPAVLRLNGLIDKDALAFAFKNIIDRHEVLRTVFAETEGGAYQLQRNADAWQLTTIDGVKFAKNPTSLHTYIEQLVNTPFDLRTDYMLHAYLINLSKSESILVVVIHHIASDGWSLSVLVKELVELYDAKIQNRPSKLTPLLLQYSDYAIWQRSALMSLVLDEKLNYWKQKLNGVSALELPLDFARPAIQRMRGALKSFRLDKKLKEKLTLLSKSQEVTLYMTLLATFKVLLYRYSGQEDICVGSGIAGRQQQDIEDLIGFFVNTLALRSNVNGEVPFSKFLQSVKTTTLEAYGHQEVPFEKVVDAIVKERDLSRNPLFQVMFMVQNTPDIPQLNLGAVAVSTYDFQPLTSRFDLTFTLTEIDNELDLEVEYDTDLFKPGTIDRMMLHYKELLNSVISNPETQTGELKMLSPAEEITLLQEFNDTNVDHKKDVTVITLFEEQLAKNPTATAIVFENEQVTFTELNDRANQLAAYLKQTGIKQGIFVPIYLDRSIEMMVGVLGILKAGGAYVPIDPAYPADRVKYILDDIAASIAVTNTANAEKLIQASGGLKTIILDSDNSPVQQQPKNNPSGIIKPNDLAYVIYTSGSTGKPKGVMIEHSNLMSYLVNNKTKYVNDTKDTSGSYIHLSFTFDASLTAMFMPILSGKLVVISAKSSVDIFEDENLTKYAPYDFIKITPAHLELIHPKLRIANDKLLTGRLVIGGEALLAGHFTHIIEDDIEIEIINEYGPTEATVGCSTYSFYPVADYQDIQKSISIGKPIDNTQLYILDAKDELVAIGIVGQICIGGDGLSRGYVNLPELTAEKFVGNPFNPASKIYKTGDLGRWLPDGNIEYLGRVDDQVKVRGYRIELGEIESVLNQSENVNQAVVLAKQDSRGDKRLLSYYVPDWDVVKDEEHKHYLQQVATWKELYEIEYGQTEDVAGVDEEFNIIGWNDSFTGLPMSAEHMRLWLDDTVNLVLSENPGRVLEIGCGTGLIFYRLAGKVEKYLGVDLSRSSINQITARIGKGLRNYGPVELWVSPAHEVSLPEGEQVDTILFNSMVQYFPGEGYMDDVMARSIALLNGKGRVIIGDVRDNRSLAMFKTRLQMQKLQSTASIQELNWAVEQELLKEEELCLSPEYFYRLQSLYPQITNVEIEWKHGDYVNELTLYRYNVIIYVGVEKAITNLKWNSWQGIKQQDIITQLNNGVDLVAIKDAPNPRLWKEKILNRSIVEKAASSLNELSDVIVSEDSETNAIRQIIDIAEAKGYHYRLMLDEDLFKVNIVFEKTANGSFMKNDYAQAGLSLKDSYSNIPLFSEISTTLKKGIHFFLKERLPEYMIPQDFIAVKHLPLTNNGKIDRRFLGQREEVIIRNTLNYQPASTATEQKLVTIWQDLLNAERIGIHDNFFDLGGHSLLATRLTSAIRRHLEIELAIKEVFNYPTIALLSAYLDVQNKGILFPSITAIRPRPEQIPLSFSQERLWFIDQLEGSVQYHIPAVLRLNGELNKEALAHTLRTIIDRHEVLRTVIVKDTDGIGHQQIMAADGWSLNSSEQRTTDEATLSQYIAALIGKPFNLSADYMLRAELIGISNQEHLLVLIMHHIASDGWSTSILVKEVVEIYEAFLAEREAKLPLLPVQYADYAIWQRGFIQGEFLDNKLDYWKKKLNGVSPLQLPTDYSRPAIQSSKGTTFDFKIDQKLSTQLKALSQAHGATLYITLLSAFKILLYRYSGQEDICVGTPIAGRNQQELEGLIGFFINTLALRTQVSGDMTLSALFEEVKTTTLEAYGHQEVPFEKVVDAVVKTRDMSRSPLFQVMFSLQNTPVVPDLKLGGLSLSAITRAETTAKFDIAFLMTETESGTNGTVEYSTDLYNGDTIARMVNHYLILLGAVIASADTRVGALNMLSGSEKQVLLSQFNDTSVAYSKDKNIVVLFEEQAANSPDSIALIDGDERLTYRELNERSNQLARYLQKQGVTAETLVPVCIERSLKMVIGLLGIMKAGGSYVPIDPEYPQARINYMLEDTGAKLVLSSIASKEKLSNSTAKTISIDSDWNQIVKEESSNLNISIAASQLAYVIYTSGSTGKPKGVMIEHQSATAFIDWCKAEFSGSNFDVVYATTSICFDLSVFELFYPLSVGKPVRILESGLAIPTLLANDSSVLINTVPSVIEGLLNGKTDLSDVSVINMAGEPIPSRVLDGLDAKRIEVRNLYGPTEDTTYSMLFRLENGKPVLIGKPISNSFVYILNSDQALSPVGVPGELCIGGDGLARGYLNRSELTAEKFVKDPFSEDAKAKLYKTGDLARWLPDGNIEYLGRIDDQVKVRGYRIELGEIENVLNQSGLVNQAVVLAKDDGTGNRRLAGYVVPAGTFDKAAIQAYLSTKLPEYMVPRLWVTLDSIPLTPNGKIDRKALPDPELTDVSTEYVAPRNEIEIKLAAIWQELLQTKRAGVYDDFFEMGGHSLLAMRVVSAIERDLSVSIPIHILFQFSTINDLGKYIEFEMQANGNDQERSTDEFDVVNI